MASIIMILGKSGTGKSTSLKSLDPKTTVVVNVLGKRLPFKGSNVLYSPENKNLFRIDDYMEMISLLNACGENPNIKNIVIDDAIYVMRKEYFKRAKETGYNKFVELAQHFQQIISICEALRDDINVFMILHSEDIQSDRTITGYKVSTIGKMLDDCYNPMEVVPIVLYSSIKFDDKGKPTYGFYTHTSMEGTIQVPAKSPDGMFKEDFIPNDLGLVVEAINEYYN